MLLETLIGDIKKPNQNEWLRGTGFSIAVGFPLLLNYYSDHTPLLVFISLGAMFGVLLDPCCTPRGQTIAIVGGTVAMALSAIIGVLLMGHPLLAMVALFAIIFLAGHPKPDHGYFNLLGKFMAAAILYAEAGELPLSMMIVWAFGAGALWALVICIIMGTLSSDDAILWSPTREFRELMAGKINDILFRITLPITVLVATLCADSLHVTHASWVGITVIFVMHVDDTSSWKRLLQRLTGTFLGVIISYLIVRYINSMLLPLAIILFSLLIPWSFRQTYFGFSTLITVLVLLLIDLLMSSVGGDLSMIRWRFYDTMIGCLWVALALIIVRFIKQRCLKNS